MEFQGACIGPLYNTPQLLNLTSSIAYELVTALPADVSWWYYDKVVKWGFVPPYEHRRKPCKYRVYKGSVNITRWFSTITVLRYLWESPALVQEFYNRVYQQEDIDDWVMFAALHSCKPGGGNQLIYGYGHTLFSYAPSKLVNPVEKNKELSKTITGFKMPALFGIQTLWGGPDDMTSLTSPPTVDELYTELKDSYEKPNPGTGTAVA